MAREYWAKLTKNMTMRLVYFDPTPEGQVLVTQETLKALYEGGQSEPSPDTPARYITYPLMHEILEMRGFQQMHPQDDD